MVDFVLRVRISKNKNSKAYQRDTLGEYVPEDKIYVNLFNLKRLKWNTLINSFCGLMNHEVTHYFIYFQKIRGKKRIKEKVCCKMEVNRIRW